MANIFSLYGSIFIDNEKANKGIDETTKKGETAGSKVGSAFGNIAKTAVATGTAVVGAATALGGAALGAAEKLSAHADEIDKVSQKLGLSREAYQEWDYVLSQAGVEITSMQTGLKTLTNKLDDAKNGSSSATAMFEKLGLSMSDLQNMSREDAFNSVITAMQGMEDSTERAALANDLFGKSGQELTALFNTSAEATENLKNKAHELGMVMSDEAVTAGVNFTDAMDTLKRSGEGLFMSFASGLMPIIQSVVDILIANMPTIQAVISQMAPIITSLFEQLMPPLMELGQTLFPILIDLIMQIIPPCMEIISAVLPVITQLLQMLLPPILQIVEMVLPLLLSLIEPILPLLEPIIALLQPLIDLLMAIITPLVEILNAILPPLIDVISKVIEIALVPLQGAFTVLAGILSGTVTAAFAHVQNIIDTAKGVMTGLIDFVKNVFTGNWRGAWEAVKNIFSSVFDGIKNAFKIPINWIIDGINSFIRGLNKLKIPDWVPGVGGKGINIGTIPRLRVGIDYVPYDDFPALLHKGERVLTASEAKAQEKQQSAETSKTASPLSLEMNLNIENFNNQSDRDIKSLIDEIMILIEEYLRRKGLVWA